MLRLAALIGRLAEAARGGARRAGARVAPRAAVRRGRETARRAAPAPRPRRQRRIRLLEQLALDLGPDQPRWRYSRLVVASAHHARIVEHLEFTRRFFPELNGVTIRVGLARKRGVLGWGSLDPERPGVWVRPRRLHLFTIAHEFTHLLQARGLVPRGERACDLWALARTPLLVDSPPSYLRVPRALRRGPLTNAQAHTLCSAARRAIEARERGDRRYLARFERELEALLAGADPA